MSISDEPTVFHILEHSFDAAFLTHPDGTIIYANPAACSLFGYTLDEFQSLGRSAIVDSSDPVLIEALAERCETGRFHGLLTLRRKDGSRFAADLSSTVYINSGGKLRARTYVKELTT